MDPKTKKILSYTSFALTSILVILVFITATTYTQLGTAVLLYPVIAFFAYRIFIVTTPKPTAASPQINTPVTEENKSISSVEIKSSDISIKDLDKRAFLKLVGATGISYFLFSLLNRRTDALLFGGGEKGISTLTDTQGNKIDPSQKQPLDGYIVSEIDEGPTTYYGFINHNGGWYIMREKLEDGSFRYIKGNANFSSNWISREKHNYDYFYNVFP